MKYLLSIMLASVAVCMPMEQPPNFPVGWRHIQDLTTGTSKWVWDPNNHMTLEDNYTLLHPHIIAGGRIQFTDSNDAPKEVQRYSIKDGKIHLHWDAKSLIEWLGSEGEICKVYGHQWREGRSGEGNGVMFTDYHPNTIYRTCKICKLCQSQKTYWK